MTAEPVTGTGRAVNNRRMPTATIEGLIATR
jgi:hypothetical protein